jgi:hypothetical protein
MWEQQTLLVFDSSEYSVLLPPAVDELDHAYLPFEGWREGMQVLTRCHMFLRVLPCGRTIHSALVLHPTPGLPAALRAV